MTATARIHRLVRAAIPKGKPFRVIWEPIGIGRWRILRVVTPAWKSLSRSERILKVQQAVEPGLTARERAQVFRFSVLTAAELKRLEAALPAELHSASRSARANGRHKAAA
jgi:hypothetical protein